MRRRFAVHAEEAWSAARSSKPTLPTSLNSYFIRQNTTHRRFVASSLGEHPSRTAACTRSVSAAASVSARVYSTTPDRRHSVSSHEPPKLRSPAASPRVRTARTDSEDVVDTVFADAPPAHEAHRALPHSLKRTRHRLRRPLPTTTLPRRTSATHAVDASRKGRQRTLQQSPLHDVRAKELQLSPVEVALCQQIREGAWQAALKVLQEHRDASMSALATSSPVDDATAAPSSSLNIPRGAHMTPHQRRHLSSIRLMGAALEERCLWVMLWCGEESAAWWVWRAMARQAPRHASRTDPRLLLVLTLFVHCAVQDAQRTRDMLLLLGATVRAVGHAKTAGDDSDKPHTLPVAPHAWISLFAAWLRCQAVDSSLPQTAANVFERQQAEFLDQALHHLARCVVAGEKKGASVVALLLLSVPNCLPAALTHRVTHADYPTTAAASLALRVVLEETGRHATAMSDGQQATPPPCSGPAVLDEQQSEDDRQLEKAMRREVRSALSLAKQQLSQLHRNAKVVPRSVAGNGTHGRTARVPAGVSVYRFWFKQVMYALGEDDVWAALRGEMSPRRSVRSAEPVHGPSSPFAQLQRINAATDQRDWVTALQLCLEKPLPGLSAARDTAARDDGGPARLPWLQRLRKGLTACEAAGRSDGVAWQGALALWHFARAQQSAGATATATPPLTREFGRVFTLLASSRRWAEALACLEATPATSVDAFTVSQVGFALRAAAAHHDRAVLDLWAAWRCRVGDTAEPSAEMVVQLLQAMLHTSSGEAGVTATADAPAAQAAEVAEVATRLLTAAAVTTNHNDSRASELRDGESATQDVESMGLLPGASVPLDWQRHHHLVSRILEDRWTGGWAEALQVALASGDVAMLRSVAPRVPPAHPPTLYRDTVRRLRRAGVALTAADQAALWSLWGGVGGDGVPSAAAAAEDSSDRTPGRAGVNVRQAAQSAESLLDELLGTE